ncbi:hypothetical protein [Vibrio phage phiKT1019]|nr:hypothetical protein [Vibrio phage phiKT1019]
MVTVCLNEYTELMNNEHSVFNGIALVHEALINLGYHVLNLHTSFEDNAKLHPARVFIQTALADQTNGISTDVDVVVRPSMPGCYAVMFFQ